MYVPLNYTIMMEVSTSPPPKMMTEVYTALAVLYRVGVSKELTMSRAKICDVNLCLNPYMYIVEVDLD